MALQQQTIGPYNTPETIIASNEPHMALCFVLDVSGSMVGSPIRALNEGLNRFKTEVLQDPKTARILDVAIITFDHEYRVAQNFLPISDMMYCDFETRGGTAYSQPIREALKMVKDRRKHVYGPVCYKPWIVFVTDGYPEHDEKLYPGQLDDVITEVRQQMENEKVSFRSLGVGDYDPQVLHRFSNNVIKMEGYDFTAFFDWVNKSMANVSRSKPGEKPQAVNLEKNLSRDRSTDDMD